jgi:hypothetical protein
MSEENMIVTRLPFCDFLLIARFVRSATFSYSLHIISHVRLLLVYRPPMITDVVAKYLGVSLPVTNTNAVSQPS